MRIFLSLILLFSCSQILTPEERGIAVTDRIGVFNQTKAMFAAQVQVEDEFGIELGDLSTQVTVYWSDSICPRNGQFAVIYKGQCNYGRMFSCSEMYVALSNLDSERTCGSALLHEFGHCMSMMMGNDGDANHSDSRLWNAIGDAMTVQCERGW